MSLQILTSVKIFTIRVLRFGLGGPAPFRQREAAPK